MASVMPGMDAAAAVDGVAHVIQVALTPVFLLSGIGTLLNMFNTRQARISDHAEHTTELLKATPDANSRLPAHLKRLRARRLAMDAAVMLAAVGAAATCGAAFALFLGGLSDSAGASWLFVLFGTALACTVASLTAFLLDTLLAWHGLRIEGPMPHPPGATRG